MSEPLQTVIDKWVACIPDAEMRSTARQELQVSLFEQRDEGIEIGQRLGKMWTDRIVASSEAHRAAMEDARADRDNVHRCYTRLWEDLDRTQEQLAACDSERMELWNKVYRTEYAINAPNYAHCALPGYFCYSVPIFEDCQGSLTLSDYILALGGSEDGIERRKEVGRIYNDVQQTCRGKLDWNGTMLRGPYVVGLPVLRTCLAPVLLWEQEGDGKTFVCSPERMPWLEAY